MPNPKIRADYDGLSQVTQTFSQQAEASGRLLQAIKRQKDVLQAGDWVGEGANAFYQEMDDSVLPTLTRLTRALDSAAQITGQISALMKQAENQAASVLKGDGAGRAAGPGGGAVAGMAAGLGGVTAGLGGVTAGLGDMSGAAATLAPGLGGGGSGGAASAGGSVPAGASAFRPTRTAAPNPRSGGGTPTGATAPPHPPALPESSGSRVYPGEPPTGGGHHMGARG